MEDSRMARSMQAGVGQPAAGGPNSTIARPQRSARILLLAIALGLCNQTYWLYSDVDRWRKGYWDTFIAGQGLAPEQYRIGVKMAAWWMVRQLGWGFRHGFLLMDLIGVLTAVFLLYALLQRRRRVRTASVALQWFASAAFLALICFYLAWVDSFFRPETLPTIGLAAVMLWLWTGWDRANAEPLRHVGIAGGLVAAAAVAAWIRADVPVALNAGMFLGCLMSRRRGVPYRSWKLATALGCAAIATGIQLYITRVLYPHTSYGPIPIFMVRYDLRQPLTFPPFLCFMLPVAWTLVQFWRDRSRRWRNETDAGLVIGSVLYLLLWVVLGKLDEVRIFVPFALALTPLTVDLALRRISSAPTVEAADADWTEHSDLARTDT